MSGIKRQIRKLNIPEIELPQIGCSNVGICRVDYLSVRGKWLTFSRMLALVFIPIMAGWVYTIYTLADSVKIRDQAAVSKNIMLKAIRLGNIVYCLQKERDMSILYVSRFGNGFKSFLLQEYDKTDKAIAEMNDWPTAFRSAEKSYLKTKRDFTLFIIKHRSTLHILSSEVYDEIVFYTEMIEFIMEWMATNIKSSGVGHIWKYLVVFQKITECMLDTGIERAYGAMFFTEGGFSDPNYYEFYFRRIYRFNYNFKSASFYTDIVYSLSDNKTRQENISEAIDKFRDIIKRSNNTEVQISDLDAKNYFDNVSLREDYIFTVQTLIANKIIKMLNETEAELLNAIITYGVIVVIVILFCPIISIVLENLMSNIQKYSKVLDETSTDLDLERTKTDSLLYRMLPKAIVNRLKRSSKIESEFFDSVTIMFSSIENFTRLSIEYTAIELTQLLNCLYTSIDDRLEKYDVYKVETINDNYMVASGVPTTNGKRHASEIAYLSLDIRSLITSCRFQSEVPIPIRLLFGINTGSVSAGIVGTQMLRYCLFGDAVNIASRMKSNSEPNQILMSSSTHQYLEHSNLFEMRKRGSIIVKRLHDKNGILPYYVDAGGQNTRVLCEKTISNETVGRVGYELFSQYESVLTLSICIVCITKKRGSSFSVLSRHLYARALPDVGCGRFCRVDYLSSMGKWLTFSKLMTLVLVPVLTGWSFTIYSLAENIKQRDETVDVRAIRGAKHMTDVTRKRVLRTFARGAMLKAVALGRIIYKLQKERDMSILYISRIGPGTKSFLIREYEFTDISISELWQWPEEFSLDERPYFRTKAAFITFLNQHRAHLDENTSEVYDEIVFYTEVVDFLMDWMVVNIKEGGFGYTWKSLVVFQKITRCMLDTGIERAYGAMFFAQGNFPDSNFYDFYFRRIHRFNYSYRSATYYSNLVDPLISLRTDQINITTAIQKFRNIVKYSNFTGSYTSITDAQSYFDNVTLRVDYMYSLQDMVAERIIRRINVTVTDYVTSIIVYSVIATIVILSCPVIMLLSETLTSHIQTYSKILVKASDDLDVEKSKTDSLLYQMLPKAVVERLKKSSKVDSEYFKSATIMFSSIVNFTRMSIEYTPLELVDLLNVLYTSFDEKIEKYDVYKVETINDNYMVVSGVPVPNGMRHASEIAYLALDIRHMISHAVYTPMIRIPIQLLLGISTGSVSAGIVGTQMLRYCLFGDTVNIASRMKSNGKPNRIQMSEPTHRNLSKMGCFRMQQRGKVSIKGKGDMVTYWLLGALEKPGLDVAPSSYKLPGEMDVLSNDDSSTGASPAYEKEKSYPVPKRRTSSVALHSKAIEATYQKDERAGPESPKLEEYNLF